jgi:hypothetical protein
MPTIVSAFISNVNSNRNIEDYINYGKRLCNVNVNKVIFIEQEIYNTYFINEIYPNTIFIFTNKEEIYLYKYNINNLEEFDKLYTVSPLKDTYEYIYIICNKTEWIRQAIEINPYNTDNFIWVDFGIYHVVNNEELFNEVISNLANKSYDNIRIASGTHYNLENIYTNVQWFFLGGIFGGNKRKLIEFADLMKEKCINIIEDKKTIMWEINVWFLIYLENSFLFDRYIANHNVSMIEYY